jgi:hypothetical protein
MNVLVIDVGGHSVKILATGQDKRRELPSGATLTAEQMVAGVKTLAADWTYDVVAIGYPGPVLHGQGNRIIELLFPQPLALLKKSEKISYQECKSFDRQNLDDAIALPPRSARCGAV